LKANYERVRGLEEQLKHYEDAKAPKIEQPRMEAPRGFLDYRVDMERTLPQISKILNRITPQQIRIGKQFQVHTQSLATHQARGTLTPRRAQKIASAAAKDMDRFSGSFERTLGPLRQTTDLLAESLTGWIDWASQAPGADTTPLGQFRDVAVRPLLDNIRVMRSAIGSYRETLVGLRGTGGVGVSQDMNRASDRLLPLIDEMLRVTGVLENSIAEVVTTINRRLTQNTDGPTPDTAGSST